jgi:hypothetical protein
MICCLRRLFGPLIDCTLGSHETTCTAVLEFLAARKALSKRRIILFSKYTDSNH